MDQASTLETLLSQLERRVALDEGDRAAILALPHSSRALNPGEHLIRETGTATHCAVVLSGFVIRHKIINEGARQIVGIQMKGDFVDLQNLFLDVSDHNVQALTSVKLALIPRGPMRHIMFARPAVGAALIFELLVEASIYREWIANVGQRDSRQRVCHLLCEFGYRLQAAGLAETCDFELPMTQEQLADAVGLTAVHVNRTLMALDAEGVTNRKKRSVQIADWELLAKVGDFNDRYLHPTAAAAPI